MEEPSDWRGCLRAFVSGIYDRLGELLKVCLYEAEEERQLIGTVDGNCEQFV
jgi:hypothetical protein